MNNNEPYCHVLLPANDTEGKPVLVVLAKRTYDLKRGDQCIPSADQIPLFPADQFFDDGDPMTTSCEFESDYIPYKPSVDVVLNGKAHAPGGSPVRSLQASLTIGSKTKTIQVTGDRQCRYKRFGAPSWSDPEPFAEMELRYERAYGGVDVHSQDGTGALAYPMNIIALWISMKMPSSSPILWDTNMNWNPRGDAWFLVVLPGD